PTLPLPASPFLPYTTLFRSVGDPDGGPGVRRVSLPKILLGERLRLGRSGRAGPRNLGNLPHPGGRWCSVCVIWGCPAYALLGISDRKSTRLNSSHQIISYAV